MPVVCIVDQPDSIMSWGIPLLVVYCACHPTMRCGMSFEFDHSQRSRKKNAWKQKEAHQVHRV